MTLSATVVKQVSIKSDADTFLETYRYRPHHISRMSPDKVKGVELLDGEWGTVGSVIVWHIIHDGKPQMAKEVIEAIDEKNKSVGFKVIEGDIMKAYKKFSITIHVDTHGEENVVTWTFDYEKLNEDVEDPDNLIDLCLSAGKDVETHHLPRPN